MEKLTFEVHDEGMFVKETDVKTYEVEDEVIHTENAIRKLAEYEDLEEQGKLLRLPCAVGDTVYTLNTLPSGKTVIGETTADAFICALGMLEGRFAEMIFLTKEAAVAKQAEMEGKK